MYKGNPEGVWLVTPAANGEGWPANAFGVGFSFRALTLVALYLMVLVITAVYAHVRKPSVWLWTMPLLAATVFCGVLVFIGDYISTFSPTPPFW